MSARNVVLQWMLYIAQSAIKAEADAEVLKKMRIADVIKYLALFHLLFSLSICSIILMSRLNAKAFEFVPGQAFKVPSQPQSQPQSLAQDQPSLQPIERPEQTESPKPPPTISLNIGGSQPPAPPPTSKPQPDVPKPAAVKEAKTAVSSKSSSPAPPINLPSTNASTKEFNFSSEKAKTDVDAIIAEQQAKVDSATIADLYGDCKPYIDDQERLAGC
jgi:peptide chain release factor subunit 3